jgi:hypothetical protein
MNLKFMFLAKMKLGQLWLDFTDVADLSRLDLGGFFMLGERVLPGVRFRLGEGFAIRVRF